MAFETAVRNTIWKSDRTLRPTLNPELHVAITVATVNFIKTDQEKHAWAWSFHSIPSFNSIE